MVCGIYIITNKITGKQYIGQSKHIKRRIKEHKQLKDIKTSYVEKSIKKYGWENFTWDILWECSQNELYAEEKKFIRLYGTRVQGYNLTWGGEMEEFGNPMYNPDIARRNGQSRVGIKHSKERKLKIAKTKTTTGFYRVSLESCKKCKFGFIYRYEYNQNGKKKYIRSTDIKKLKKKIIQKGMEWIVLDENLANKTIDICNKNLKKQIEEHSTGIFRVIKHKDKSMNKGYIYRYTYYDNGVPHYMENKSLGKLKQRVISKGLEWLELREIVY